MEVRKIGSGVGKKEKVKVTMAQSRNNRALKDSQGSTA